MSINVDIQNQNTDLQYGNDFPDTIHNKETSDSPTTNKESVENSNTQMDALPTPCDSESSATADCDGNLNTAEMETDTQEVNSNCPVIDPNNMPDSDSTVQSTTPHHDVENKNYEDLTHDNSESSSSQSQPHAAEPVSSDNSFASLSTGADFSSTQNSTNSQTPDSLPDIAENKSISATATTPSDISYSSQSTSNAAPSSSTAEHSSDSKSGAVASSSVEPQCSASAKDDSPTQSIYHIKWIKFRDESCPIITQNENGPCPLIAIMNVLLLQRKVKFPPMMEMVTSNQLMDYLGDCILEYAPKNMSEDSLLNYEQNMHDAMAVFHKLQTGLDVNVRFTGVDTFEYTSECIVFDLLQIHVYHGWLVDPEDSTEVSAVGHNSYNQLVEMIIGQKHSPREELVREALVAEEFLNRSSHQLTYHGLSELASTVKENELCVFFRNNHFSTLLKQKNELFLLVTDQGFLTEPNVVWETLSNVEGDGHFVDALFHTYRKPEPSTHTIPTSSVAEGSAMQIDQDYLVALSLQQEQQQQQQQQQPSETQTVAPEWSAPALSDHELALKLQEEENRRVAVAMQRQQQQQQQQPQQHHAQQHGPPQHRQNQSRASRENSSQARKKDGDSCTIL